MFRHRSWSYVPWCKMSLLEACNWRRQRLGLRLSEWPHLYLVFSTGSDRRAAVTCFYFTEFKCDFFRSWRSWTRILAAMDGGVMRDNQRWLEEQQGRRGNNKDNRGSAKGGERAAEALWELQWWLKSGKSSNKLYVNKWGEKMRIARQEKEEVKTYRKQETRKTQMWQEDSSGERGEK